MPVAHLVHLFETMDFSLHETSQIHSKNMLKRRSILTARRLTLKTIFRSHTRANSSSSIESAIEPTDLSTSSSNSIELPLASTSTHTSPLTECEDPFATMAPPCQPSMERLPRLSRPIKVQRTFSSTSLALQSELRQDRLKNPSLNLFEPRPHDIVYNSSNMIEPVIMDGIMEVMRSD